MTIEEWFQEQKKLGNVYLPLFLDDKGDQYVKTHASATKYGNSNVEEKLDQIDASCFYLQDGYTKTAKGLIRVPEGTDPKSIHYSGCYTCAAWQEGSIPIASNEVILQVDMLDSYSRMITAKYPVHGCVFTDTLNTNHDTWSGWKLTAGEVLLWEGNISMGLVNINMDARLFGHIEFHNTNGIFSSGSVNLTKGNNSVKASSFETYDDKCYLYATTAVIGDRTLNMIRSYGFMMNGTKTNIITTKIIGKP